MKASADQGPPVYLVITGASPYNTDMLNSVCKELPIKVAYILRGTENSPWTLLSTDDHSPRYFRAVIGIDWQTLFDVIRARDTVFITTAWQDPTCLLLITCLMLLSRPYAFWNDTPWRDKPRFRLKAVLRSGLLRILLGRASAVLGTGVMATKELISMGANPRDVFDFPYFIDVAKYPRTEYLLRPPFRFVSVGRLIPIKAYDLAIRVLARLKKEQGLRFTYEIAGTGPEAANLNGLARDRGLGDEVKLVGFLEGDQLRDFYRKGGIFLHPAQFEPYGVVILEAMASGMPVIASSRSGAAVDRVREHINGYIFETGDEQSFFAAISAVLKADLQAMSDAARATAEQWPLSRAANILKQVAQHMSRGRKARRDDPLAA